MVLTRKSIYDTIQSTLKRITQHGFELTQHLYVFLLFGTPCIVCKLLKYDFERFLIVRGGSVPITGMQIRYKRSKVFSRNFTQVRALQ